MKDTRKFVTVLLFILALSMNAFAQDGKVNEVFSSKSPLNWKSNTKGGSVEIKGDKLVVTPALQSDGTYRGDIGSIGSCILDAGKYPILAIKMKKTNETKLAFDTNLGTCQGGLTKIASKDGLDVFYINLSLKSFRRALDEPFKLSLTEPSVFKSVSFKISGITYSQDQIDNKQITYEVAWIKAFASIEEFKSSIATQK